MKRSLTKVVLIIMVSIFSMVSVVSAAGVDYGSAGAKAKSAFTLGEMLNYAIQDENLALAEYEKIISVFGTQRPFSNIISSEKNHISLLKPLFEKYGLVIPKNTSNNLTVVPSSILEAMKIGVQAEIDNIAMYEKFLKQDLPKDVRDIFTYLKDASKNHLKAFENGVSREEGLKTSNSSGNRGRTATQGRNR